jgi:cell division protein FtsI/penicillin-binding protein 2
MCGAVSFGTAEKADLDSLPVYIAGKTGTSTQLGGFRSQGWFAGIAFNPNTQAANAQLIVVVYLKNAHGSEAAVLARPIFEQFAETTPNSRNNHAPRTRKGTDGKAWRMQL